MKFTINQKRNTEAMKQRKIKVTYLGSNKWKVEDKTLNHLEYTLTCLEMDNFTIQYKDKYDNFLVYMNNKGNIVEVVKAIENGRNKKADRFLKKYNKIACMLNGLVYNNMLKVS